MAKNKNLTQAKKAKNDEFDWSELTPSQKAKKKYELKHRVPDSEFLKELRNPYIPEEWFIGDIRKAMGIWRENLYGRF